MRIPLDIALRIVAGLFACTLIVRAAMSQEAPERQLLVPSDEALAIMIKTDLIAFNNANLTGNYSVFRDLASPDFSRANSQVSLAEVFRDLRERNIDISPIVLFQPKLTGNPVIDNGGLLQMSGFFLTSPEQVHFDLAYQVVGGHWRLFGISVVTQKPAQVADEAVLGRAPTAETGTSKTNLDALSDALRARAYEARKLIE